MKATTRIKFFYPLALSLALVLPFKQGFAKDEKQTTSSISTTSHYSSWGVDPDYQKSNINLANAFKIFKKKREVVVAVIDTGIDPNHSFIKDNLYTATGKISANNYGVDFSKGSEAKNSPIDKHGHGTHVTGIIKSVHPGVKILALKYYNPQASGQDNLDSTIMALEYAVNANVDIINYSGGGPEPAAEEQRILKLAEKKGILVVAAAGNEKSNIDNKKNAYYPASYGLSNIITVTAHNQSLNILDSSNWGKRSVDLSAPGYSIKSSVPQNRAGYMTGTSQATAFVSGAAALIKAQFPLLNAKQIKEIIKKSASNEPTLTSKTSSSGRLNTYNALMLAKRVIENKQNPDAKPVPNNGRGVAKRIVIKSEEKNRLPNSFFIKKAE